MEITVDEEETAERSNLQLVYENLKQDKGRWRGVENVSISYPADLYFLWTV